MCIEHLTFNITYATVRFVSKSGSSTPPYTSWETASDSIQKCINLCVNGDTIYVANGVYKENLVINTTLSLIGGSNMNNHNLPVMGWGGSEDFFGGMINKVGDVDGDGINDFEVGTATMTGTCRSGYFMIFKGDTSVTTGIDEQPIQLADDFELYEPYPNPFNPNVTIAFKISKSSSITLTLYDILGKEIKQIIKNQQREAGKYEEVIDTSELSLSSGVYVIQLQAVSDNKIIFSSSKKLNLIK